LSYEFGGSISKNKFIRLNQNIWRGGTFERQKQLILSLRKGCKFKICSGVL
jgi:hypothetical protein